MSPLTAPRMEDTAWEPCCLDEVHDPELDRFLSKAPMAPPGVRCFAPCPWVARSMIHLDIHHGRLMHIDLELAEKIALMVSQDNSCRYCFADHSIMLQFMGLGDADVREIAQNMLTVKLRPGERAALQFAHRLSRFDPHVRPEEIRALHDEGYSNDQLKEIAFVVGWGTMMNRIATLPALRPEPLETMLTGIRGRLFKPFMRRAIKRHWRAGISDHFANDVGDIPYAFLVRALDGLPSGRALFTVIAEAWDNPPLPARSKALICAVIARTLNCPEAERYTNALLAEHGFTPEDIAAVLANLSSPKLDPIEAAVVPAARETVWYTPPLVQRRIRSLQHSLDTAQFVDFVGTTSLANMLCRMCGVLQAL